MKRALLFVGILLVFVVAVVMFLKNDDPEPATLVPSEGAGARVGDEGDRGAAQDEADSKDEPRVDAESIDALGAAPQPAAEAAAVEGPATRTVTEEELGEIDIEQQERERLERVEAFHAEHGGPISCESVCDCPQGLDCQLPPGICVPGTRDVFCCTDDLCPAGVQCSQPNGRLGVCADN